MSDNMSSLIAIITKSNLLHARWINTFSYLEYIGFRKIVKSQTSENVDLDTLTHAVEEGRHALKLKIFAVKLGGKTFEYYSPSTLLCPNEAKRYFHVLDQTIFETLLTYGEGKAQRLTYLYVTWLVEVRALSIYETYQKTTQSASSPFRGILLEEESHLAKVLCELRTADADFESRKKLFSDLEEDLYISYIEAVSKELSGSLDAVV